MQFHRDPLFREELIRDYLLKRLDAETAESFESHYLVCEECFEQLRVGEMLASGLGRSKLEVRRVEDVVVLRFAEPAQLTRQSFELEELTRVFQQKDTKVLIDLRRVTKIDSAGLGQLMSFYSHVVKNQGALKLINANTEVQAVLHATKVDSLLETYNDEHQALKSFDHP